MAPRHPRGAPHTASDGRFPPAGSDRFERGGPGDDTTRHRWSAHRNRCHQQAAPVAKLNSSRLAAQVSDRGTGWQKPRRASRRRHRRARLVSPARARSRPDVAANVVCIAHHPAREAGEFRLPGQWMPKLRSEHRSFHRIGSGLAEAARSGWRTSSGIAVLDLDGRTPCGLDPGWTRRSNGLSARPASRRCCSSMSACRRHPTRSAEVRDPGRPALRALEGQRQHHQPRLAAPSPGSLSGGRLEEHGWRYSDGRGGPPADGRLVQRVLPVHDAGWRRRTRLRDRATAL